MLPTAQFYIIEFLSSEKCLELHFSDSKNLVLIEIYQSCLRTLESYETSDNTWKKFKNFYSAILIKTAYCYTTQKQNDIN